LARAGPAFTIAATKGGAYSLMMHPDGKEEIFRANTSVALSQPGHLDYDLRTGRLFEV
jgi:hypothetical protein